MFDVQVGDKVLRVMPGFRDETWTMDADVAIVTDEEIVCIVRVDVPRMMRFNRSDGVNVAGRDYGWLEKQ